MHICSSSTGTGTGTAAGTATRHRHSRQRVAPGRGSPCACSCRWTPAARARGRCGTGKHRGGRARSVHVAADVSHCKQRVPRPEVSLACLRQPVGRCSTCCMTQYRSEHARKCIAAPAGDLHINGQESSQTFDNQIQALQHSLFDHLKVATTSSSSPSPSTSPNTGAWQERAGGVAHIRRARLWLAAQAARWVNLKPAGHGSSSAFVAGPRCHPPRSAHCVDL